MDNININSTYRIQAIQKINEMLEYHREQNKQKKNKESFEEILHKFKVNNKI